MPGPLTRLQVEVMVSSRCRAPMSLAGMATAAPGGPVSDDLNEPLATALDDLGLPPADRSNVVDSDLVLVRPDWQGRLVDLAEIRTLETALQGLVGRAKSIQWEDYRKDQGDPYAQLAGLIDLKWKRYQARWSQQAGLVVAPMCPQNQWAENKASYYPPFMQPPPWGY
jgi:hypothetical protein